MSAHAKSTLTRIQYLKRCLDLSCLRPEKLSSDLHRPKPLRDLYRRVFCAGGKDTYVRFGHLQVVSRAYLVPSGSTAHSSFVTVVSPSGKNATLFSIPLSLSTSSLNRRSSSAGKPSASRLGAPANHNRGSRSTRWLGACSCCTVTGCRRPFTAC